MELMSDNPASNPLGSSRTVPQSTLKKRTLTSLAFEVTGRVQGVHFRRYLKFHTIKLNVRGYAMHSPAGSVVGEIQGTDESIKHMKVWLNEIGSPDSRIDEAIFTNERPIDGYSYNNFKIS